MELCPFCEFDPRRIVFTDELVFAIWDAFPVSDGHLLVIPHRHVANWFDATEAEQFAILRGLEKGRRVVLERHSPGGFNIGVNIGTVAGQTIPHLHVHLMPRYSGDVADPCGGVRHVIPSRGNYRRLSRPGLELLGGPPEDSRLVHGADDDPLLPHLRTSLDRATAADFAVAFILKSGVELIREHLRDLLKRGGRARIVTGDYLDATDPDALVELMDLGGQLQLRVFEAASTTFHPKAYIFHYEQGGGHAFVGSSNLTHPALAGGVEWNYRVLHEQTDRGFSDVTTAFDDLFAHPRTRTVDSAWIDAYRLRRGTISRRVVLEVVEEPPAPPPEPHVIQREALAALAATRQAGNEAGLVVLATGLGKTWLAAFDSGQEEYRRVLFVAHREEILDQAMQTFRRIRPQAHLGSYTGQEKSPDADVLFASIQTLGRSHHLERFLPTTFDYIVVDEFHHAAARTYRRLIAHFTPRFLLGLTATPERMDGGDLLSLCQENLVYRRDMIAGIEAGLLCPFRYFGVPDNVDYSNIPWRSSRFDEEELTKAVATNRRAENALEQFRKWGGQRTLGFCCSRRHADFMADYFTRAGVRSVAVHSGETSAPRASALEALRTGQVETIFAVDMFNEGLDVPEVDTVLMLRPSESSIIWLQQFGRGLRCAEGKKKLTVIDYIGNHRSFLVKVRSLLQPLLGTGGSDAEILSALRAMEQERAVLPAGCHVTYDLQAVDIICSLLRTRREDDAIVSFYEDFRQRHGMRPTAAEVYHACRNPRSLRRSHGSWIGFLKMMKDLSPTEVACVEAVGDFLDALETTPMTKSFKMLTLLGMLDRDEFPGQTRIEDLANEFRRLAGRSAVLRAELGTATDNEAVLRKLIERNPIDAWCGGKGTGRTAYFSYDGATFRSTVSVPPNCREDLQILVRELIDWRMAEYLDRDQTSAGDRLVCKVIHASGRPIIKLPSRTASPDIPHGLTEMEVDGQLCTANFAKEFINVVRADPASESNILPGILRRWFGPDAGRPGTRFQVTIERSGDYWRMEPMGPTLTPEVA